MIAAITAGLIGMLLGGPVNNLGLAAAFSGCIFLAVYIAHLKDTYFDYHISGEDKINPYMGRFDGSGKLLSKNDFVMGMIVSSILLLGLSFYVASLTSYAFLIFVIIGWTLAIVYAPLLYNYLGAALSYPAGVAMAMLAGYFIQTGAIGITPLLFAIPLMVMMAGAKIVEDVIDFKTDKKLGKITTPVLIGLRRAKALGYEVFYLGLISLLFLSLIGGIKFGNVYGILAGSVVGGYSYKFKPETGVYILVVGIYIVMLTMFFLSL